MLLTIADVETVVDVVPLTVERVGTEVIVVAVVVVDVDVVVVAIKVVTFVITNVVSVVVSMVADDLPKIRAVDCLCDVQHIH